MKKFKDKGKVQRKEKLEEASQISFLLHLCRVSAAWSVSLHFLIYLEETLTGQGEEQRNGAQRQRREDRSRASEDSLACPFELKEAGHSSRVKVPSSHTALAASSVDDHLVNHRPCQGTSHK